MTNRKRTRPLSLIDAEPLPKPKPKLRVDRDIFNSITTVQIEDEYLDLEIELRFSTERNRWR